MAEFDNVRGKSEADDDEDEKAKDAAGEGTVVTPAREP